MEQIELIIQILTLLLLFYLIFFKNYVQEKGKNLATKEDIGKITTEIEKVKTEISFQNQKESDLFFERKKNLIGFYDNYFLWIDNALKIADVVAGHHNNPKTLRETINYIKKTQNEVSKYHTRLIIYLDDKEFIKAITDIYNYSVPYHNSITSFLFVLEETAIRRVELSQKLDDNSSDRMLKVIKKEYQDILQEREKAFDNFNKNYDSFKDGILENRKKLVQVYKKRIFRDYALTHNTI